eukprot:TRINITY_DN66088_c0_g1_i1.p1 TRINITY_DN66088_c0_g1~~TRINITY_DN66088_c0_g1_i1.p1  ORF type:complete len:506 (-),score=77.73 TRINITY_DN66088_c0_g1_i1:278-1795(-)
MECTACNQDFPAFKDARRIICFNLREGDAAELNISYDPFFHWHGSYTEILEDARIADPVWAEKLPEFSDDQGVQRVLRFCRESLPSNTRVFYSPGKAKRWSPGMFGPDGVVPNTTETLLLRTLREDGTTGWALQELPNDGSCPDPVLLTGQVLSRITYPTLLLARDSAASCCEAVYPDDNSQAAWLDGSTLILKGADNPSKEGLFHTVDGIPESFTAVRFVALDNRDSWLSCVMATPTFAITGATLCPGSPFASPLSVEAAVMIGSELASRSADHGVTLMASASMRAHYKAMSADHDFTLGFEKGSPDCKTVHFKGSNAVMLHGDLWRVAHGVSYVIQEHDMDFSNHAKEAALVSSAMHDRSVALLANGGPTVAVNLTRFLLLCGTGRVFSFCGLHSRSGGSGAAGSFKQSGQQLAEAIVGVGQLAPNVLGERADAAGRDIADNLQKRPLTLLELTDDGCYARKFILQPDQANSIASPGLVDGQDSLADVYAKQCAQAICQSTTL